MMLILYIAAGVMLAMVGLPIVFAVLGLLFAVLGSITKE